MKSIEVMADDVALAAEILGSIEGAMDGGSGSPGASDVVKAKKKKKKKVAQLVISESTPKDATSDSLAPLSDIASNGPLFSEMVEELRAEAADFSEFTHAVATRVSEDLVEVASESDAGGERDEGGEGAEEWTEDDSRIRFSDLGLPGEICSALAKSGYQYPTDIQSATIPALLKGRDVLGQAQTGTGKTAAFALPLLSGIDVESPETQVLVLAPTRELAIQVAESFMKYGQHLRGLRVAPIYGGSSYATQIHALKRGAHVVVGTPGRVMDHMRESRLRIDMLKCLVLDEADEMLRMGFVDDVQWILEQSPATRQIALFSATMPDPIRQIANRHLKNPHVISIESKQRTADNIEQRFITVEPRGRTEALQRILEAEDFDGMIVFVKTKIGTVELSDHLRSLGYSAVALNGDIAQTQRERTIEQLKEGVFDILVATDVAARGLDVQRITHVINYDLPFDSEAYVHRIGRTGRAGRSGQAIIFIAPRQRGFLREIDRAAGQTIEPMAIPTSKEINALRVSRFKEMIQKAAEPADSGKEAFNLFEKLLNDCVTEHGLSPIKIAAGLALLAQGDRPFFVSESSERMLRMDSDRGRRERGGDSRNFRDSGRSPRERFGDRDGFSGGEGRGVGRRGERGEGLDLGDARREKETFRVEVGRIHGVKAGNLVGAVANEIGLNSDLIGQIKIHHDFSTIDLPAGMPREVFKTLGKAWVLGRQLRISKLMDHPSERRFGKGKREAR
jgi:ATP-dependent RNA helicase DeaD